jgi:mannose-1-phosphate guanylyltransferase
MGSDLFKLTQKRSLDSGMDVYEVSEFVNVVKERMTLEQVTEISNKFTVGTHTNHYTWRPKDFFEAIKKIRPDWYQIIEELKVNFGKPNEKELTPEIYAKFEPNRFEVVTTELIKEGKLLAIKLPYDWAHITTWDDVYRYRLNHGLPVTEGELIEVESSDNLVLTKKKKLVSLIGMKEMVVVDTEDAIFIAPRSMAGRVKEVIDRLQEDNFKQYQ